MGAAKPSPSLAVYLDGLRFVSAVFVVICHARLHAFGSRDLDGGLAVQAFDLFTALGHAAVVVFFAVSGYLVGGKLYDADRAGFLRRYGRDRASRIYTVALPLMLIAFLMVAATNAFLGQSFRLTTETCRPAVSDLFLGIAFIHKGFPVEYCYISPVWSLICEVFYYTLFGLIAVVILSSNIKHRLACSAMALGLILYSINDQGGIWGYAPLWIIGAAAANPRLKSIPGMALAACALLLLGLMISLRGGEAVQEALIALTITSSILVLRHVRIPLLEAPLLASACSIGAAFSYSLYLAHAPVMNLARTIMETRLAVHLGEPELTTIGLAAWFCFSFLGILAGVLAYLAFERHTPAVRQILSDLLRVSPAKADNTASAR